ncbi:MAG: hypothetical protein K5857_00980 [Lachnospiraceae bacterium]|nr:hypothetical protein [Lachnospiraceae bacterium]
MSNLLKSNYVVKKEETRVIDSNELIANRLQSLMNEMPEETEPVQDAEFVEFKEGLNAEQLEMLLDDNPRGEETEGEVFTDELPAEEEDRVIPEDLMREAEEMVAGAREEAARIIEEASEEARALKEQEKEAGYKEGYDKGHAEAVKIIDEKMAELEEREAAINSEYDKKLEEAEPLLVDAITDIYEHIFHVNLSSNREILLNLLHDTVRNIEGGKNFIIHVSKSDYEYVNDRKDQLTDGLGSTDTIEVIEDLTLRQTEAFIEAEGGIYDCGIGTELELLKKELMLLSYQKN